MLGKDVEVEGVATMSDNPLSARPRLSDLSYQGECLGSLDEFLCLADPL
jgi:hypothetical protein